MAGSHTRYPIVTSALLGLSSIMAAAPGHAATITTGIDTFLRQEAPATSHGGRVRAEWDGGDPVGENHALLRYTIFQSEGGPIDPNAVLAGSGVQAFLEFEVVNEGDGGNIHRLNIPFVESSTWNDFGGSGVVPGVNAEATPDATTPDMGTGVHRVEVTASLQAWAANPGSNLGWGIVSTGTNGLEFATFESGQGPNLLIGSASDYVSAGAGGAIWDYWDSILPGDPNYPVDGGGLSWNDPDFDSSGWSSGAGQLGYGDGDETTTVAGNNLTYLFRTQFLAGDLPGELTLELLRDDSAIVYLNGVEIVRDNLPGGAIDADTTASGVGTENGQDIYVIDPALLNANDINTLAVEIHNVSAGSSDISFDLSLSGFSTISLSAIPEPGSGSLLGLGLIALARRGRSRR